jgi:hypothetical protein
MTSLHLAACINDIANAKAVSCTGPTDQQAIACMPNFAVSAGLCYGRWHAQGIRCAHGIATQLPFHFPFSVPTHRLRGRGVMHGNARQQYRRRMQCRVLPGRRPLFWYVRVCSGPVRIVALAPLWGLWTFLPDHMPLEHTPTMSLQMWRAQLVQRRPMQPTPLARMPLIPSLRHATRATI